MKAPTPWPQASVGCDRLVGPGAVLALLVPPVALVAAWRRWRLTGHLSGHAHDLVAAPGDQSDRRPEQTLDRSERPAGRAAVVQTKWHFFREDAVVVELGRIELPSARRLTTALRPFPWLHRDGWCTAGSAGPKPTGSSFRAVSGLSRRQRSFSPSTSTSVAGL